MGVVKRAKYRLWQFWQNFRPSNLEPSEEEEIVSILDAEEMDLFSRQDLADKQHSFRVMRTIKETGNDSEDLLKAALLHDVGKTRVKIVWWDRPIVVLAEALIPSHAERWSNGSGKGWSRPFVMKAKHAEWGADAASAAGSSSLTVELIRWHQRTDRDNRPDSPELGPDTSEREFERILTLLQQTDEIN